MNIHEPFFFPALSPSQCQFGFATLSDAIYHEAWARLGLNSIINSVV